MSGSTELSRKDRVHSRSKILESFHDEDIRGSCPGRIVLCIDLQSKSSVARAAVVFILLDRNVIACFPGHIHTATVFPGGEITSTGLWTCRVRFRF